MMAILLPAADLASGVWIGNALGWPTNGVSRASAAVLSAPPAPVAAPEVLAELVEPPLLQAARLTDSPRTAAPRRSRFESSRMGEALPIGVVLRVVVALDTTSLWHPS